MSSDYRLSPTFGARLLGLVLVTLAILVFALTALVVVTGLPAVLVLVVALGGVAVVAVAGWLVTTRAYVVRLDDTGYRVRWVRGAGVKRATWKQVTEAATTTTHGVRVVVLRLQDGGSTTIPVQVLAGDPDDFVRDLREHLRRGEGLTPLS